ncbi:MAG: universal stress protein, partial [Burkholderiales bacterium]|nr:universal stress protein [Burkholderiales bacterium]
AEDVAGVLSARGVTQFLARHGVTAEFRREIAEDIDVGNLLLSRVADFSADLVVMGGYSRPRLAERVLGGVTRSLVETMTVPVLMSH